MSDKKYPVPSELVDIWDDYVAACKARDAAVKGFFKFQVRNAVYLGNIAEKNRREFWSGIRRLYPEFDGSTLSFDSESLTVSPSDDD